MKVYISIWLFILVGVNAAMAQAPQPTPEKRVIQITGVVAETDSSNGIPFTTVRIKGTPPRGTVSDFYGFYTLVAKEGDTLVFSSVGYSPEIVILPNRLPGDNFYMLTKLEKDTVMLNKVNILPYNAKSFGTAFVNLKMDEDDYSRAMKNLSQQELEEKKMGMPVDGSVASKGYMQSKSAALYSAGGLPSPSILNPFAWAQFFKALKQGKFKDPYKDINKN